MISEVVGVMAALPGAGNLESSSCITIESGAIVTLRILSHLVASECAVYDTGSDLCLSGSCSGSPGGEVVSDAFGPW